MLLDGDHEKRHKSKRRPRAEGRFGLIVVTDVTINLVATEFTHDYRASLLPLRPALTCQSISVLFLPSTFTHPLFDSVLSSSHSCFRLSAMTSVGHSEQSPQASSSHMMKTTKRGRPFLKASCTLSFCCKQLTRYHQRIPLIFSQHSSYLSI